VEDYLEKAVAPNKQVRAYAVITTKTLQEARRHHDMQSAASVVLGRSMTAGVILGSMLKREEKLSIKMNSGGLIGTILVDAHVGLFARFPLYREKTVRILPLTYCIQNKSPPLLL
jgi:molecular chaperone Hsp33